MVRAAVLGAAAAVVAASTSSVLGFNGLAPLRPSQNVYSGSSSSRRSSSNSSIRRRRLDEAGSYSYRSSPEPVLCKASSSSTSSSSSSSWSASNSGTPGCQVNSRKAGRRSSRHTLQAAKGKGTAEAEAAAAAEEDPDRYSKALTYTSLSVAAAFLFGSGISMVEGTDAALQFFAGYVVEQSLSIDNLFVFLLLFEYFKVPMAYQPRVLSYGVLGAVVFRGIFILLGEAAIAQFQPVLLGFAGILLWSSFMMMKEADEEEDLSENAVVKFAEKFMETTEEYDGDRFFTLVEGVKKATPLLLVLACVELSDLVFAVDSIPAVFGVTTDPFIVYTSNIFAILNLRSLYTILATAMSDLAYLKPAVAVVLAFVGVKLGVEFFGYPVGTGLSLGIIASCLGGGVGLSLVENARAE